MTTIREALRLGRAHLHQSPSPALDARLLLEHVLQRDHAYLIAHDDVPLAPDEETTYRALLNRAAANEPIPYLIGYAPFMGLDFIVSHHVLIPRPETEQLVEMAIKWGKDRDVIRVADVGTGSGCIAISLARCLPRAEIAAIDVSSQALEIAAANVTRHVPGQVGLVRADLLSSIAPGLDLIAANLPYIAGHEWPTLSIGVKSYEPTLALHGGEDGLDLIGALLPQAAERLRPGGLVLLEIGWQQGEAVAALAQKWFPAARIAVRADFAGHDRIVTIET